MFTLPRQSSCGFSSRTFVLFCLLTTTKDHEKFVIQAAKLRVCQGSLMVRRKLILPFTSSHTWRAGWWFFRWKDVWFVPSLPSMGLVMWDQKSAVWKQGTQFMLSLQICGGERKGSSLSESPRHVLQWGLYFYGLTLAKLTLEEFYFQLHFWLHQYPKAPPKTHTWGLAGQSLSCCQLGEWLTVESLVPEIFKRCAGVALKDMVD